MRSLRVVVALLWLACACGPSFQVVYESDVHFEHCYALDQTTQPAGLKRSCWNDWLGSYTFGQPRDRVSYALSRANALGSASPASPEGDGIGVSAQSGMPAVAVPVPTNAFAPPPQIAPVLADAGPDGSPSVAGLAFYPGPAEAPVASIVATAAAGGFGAPGDAGAARGDASGAIAPRRRPAPSDPPRKRCVDRCTSRWQACRPDCTDAGCARCDRTYESCVPACFR